MLTQRPWLLSYALCCIGFLAGTMPSRAADQALIDAAKKDGEVTWYTTLIVNQMTRPVVDAFEKKYGIKVNFVRADSSDIVLRVVNEAKASKVQADMFDGTSGAPAFKQAGLLEKWVPDIAKTLPSKYVDPNGYWIATSLYIQTLAYNTDLVKKEDAPTSLQAILDPKWKGRMAMSASSSSPGVGGFVGLVMTAFGEQKGLDYLRQLAKQNVAIIQGSARVILDQVIAGEYAVGVQMLNHHAAFSANRGAPVAWTKTDPAMATMLVLGLLKGPHPNAGKLLIDFLMSDEGQTLFRNADYIPVAPNIEPRDPSLRPDDVNFKAIYFTPELLESGTEKWMKIYMDTLR